jgi:hypothetical protein
VTNNTTEVGADRADRPSHGGDEYPYGHARRRCQDGSGGEHAAQAAEVLLRGLPLEDAPEGFDAGGSSQADFFGMLAA